LIIKTDKSLGTMNDLTFHILDVAARDETVVAETDDTRELAYETGEEEDSDMENMSKKKYSQMKGNERLVIHLFGSDANGKPIRVDCKGFEPFFYVRVPESCDLSKCLQSLTNYIEKCIGPASKYVKIKNVKRKLMYGYTAGQLFNFIEIRSPSLKMFRNLKNLFLNDKQEPKTKWPLTAFGTSPKIYEANLDPYLRFLHLRGLKPCDWATVKDGLMLAEETDSGLVIDDCDWLDIGPCLTPPRPTAPFRIASWDIECWSESGDFPVPSKDPLIQIGTVLTKLGSNETEKHIFVLGSCEPVDGVKVRTFKTEAALIIAWFEFMDSVGVDIMIGYNIFGFDEQYVWKRCEALKIVEHESIQKMNRLCDYGGVMRLDEKRLSSSAMGDNFLHLWNTQGRLHIDLYHAVKRQYPMGSYKLDDVSRAFLNNGVASCKSYVDSWIIEIKSGEAEVGRFLVLLNESGESLSEKCLIKSVEGNNVTIEPPIDVDEDDVAKWAIVKDDLSPQEMFKAHCGSAKDRATIAAYCVQDCQLVLDIFKKLETFNNAASMANVCSVPIAHIFLRGQGIKIESLIFKYCHENQLCIEVMPSPGFGKVSDEPAESYEGAIVLDPVPGFYKVPVGVADFASLYPSTIISENISHDTLVWVKDYDLNGKLMKVKYGSEFAKYDTPSTVPFTDIEFDTWGKADDDERKNPEKIKTGLRVCRYAQDKQGAIPIIIAQLLDARKKTRALIKTEKDEFKKALLDAQQNAYKITANSLYGQLGSSVFKIRQQELAASVTAYGRKQILFAKAAIEEFYGPAANNPRCTAEAAQVVYGDSVTGDTPLYVKIGNEPQLCRFDELGGEWTGFHGTKESIELVDGQLKVWSEKGWTSVKRIIRHRLNPNKKMYRILTHTGIVDCTEDHSLVSADGKDIKPGDVSIGSELLHNDEFSKEYVVETSDTPSIKEAWAMGFFLADGSAGVYEYENSIKYSWAINKSDISVLQKAADHLPFDTKILDTLESSGVYKLVPIGNLKDPVIKYRNLFYNIHKEKRVPPCILNAPIDIVEQFMCGFYAGDGDKANAFGNLRWDQKGKEVSAGLYILARRLGYNVSINDRTTKPDVFRITITEKTQRKNPVAIKKIQQLDTTNIEYVYDIETENHHFSVGPGALVVHNTDSLFVCFNPKDPETGKPLEGIEAVKATIALTEEAGKLVTQGLKAPHDFEFDKVYWPFLIFSKKRYVGHKYEEIDHYTQASMGIALKRRDYAQIVKKIYGGAIHILLTEKNVAKAAEFVKTACKDLIDGKYGLGPLTISKSLRGEYANPNSIAHKVLADRIAVRSPGEAPAAGDRIGYVYVQPGVGQVAADLQGDRIETPAYIKANGLKPDYMFYIDHQISNPVCQLFGLLVEEVPGYQGQAWADDPDKQMKQRENVAYQLLFQGAVQTNNNTAKKNFIKMMGGVVQPPQPSTTAQRSYNPITVTKKPVVKQSSLDLFLLDKVRLDAKKKAVTAAKEKSKDK